VVYGTTLGPGTNVDLLLEYFIPTRMPVDPPGLQAFGTPAVNLTAPGSAGPNISLINVLNTNSILIEFPSVLGQSYLILYSDNANFPNALTAQPPIVAPANRVQWIDDGPPKTISPPAGENSRFYRVIQQ